MEFLNKIEEFINKLLFKLGDLISRLFFKFTPPKVLRLFTHFKETLAEFRLFLKHLPKNLLIYGKNFLIKTKEKLSSIDYKEKINSVTNLIKENIENIKKSKNNRLKKILNALYHLFSNWVQGLSSGQIITLVLFTTASFLSLINILATGNRILRSTSPGREPASILEDQKFQFSRPDYYKKEKRHVIFSSIRLPIYSGDIKDLQTVEIDFNVTLSNRHTRNVLEKFEFQLRDYLILKLEPQIPDFPLLEEGKEILRDKIWQEIDQFLKEREINGHVTEVKITYVLAN